ncbi:integrin alpha-PS3-like [Malaya genurostris]|uniref:integrin alpha-PS3-like n=1 Tax=Malaya genurostris TaxID=325434 RepID=UPI0026F3B813|nr:integrin alpha-PS3-like [Malaya genurostris]
MTHPIVTAIALLAVVIGDQVSIAYNISPAPNVIYGEPAGRKNFPKVQSSFFGMTVLLTRDHIFIGAPRAQSSSKRHLTINEPGVIFRCDLRSAFCEQHTTLDGGGFESEVIKSGQYLGATLDGTDDGAEIVACAPRMIKGGDEERAMTGICYTEVNGTTRAQRQAFNYQHQSFAFDTALEGFAVHLLRRPDDSLEVVTGLPNCNYTGAMMIYGEDRETGVYLTSEKLKRNGYFGYSVNSMTVQNKTIYLVSAPRFNGENGKVFLFEKVITSRWKAEMKLHIVLGGDESQIDYFGYSLCTEDVNGDGLTDVLIGAPFYSENLINDGGAVYVFLNKGLNDDEVLRLEKQIVLKSTYVGSGQFGYAIALIGDINYDGYNDVAIGAPFEESGRVYIFHGGPEGLLPQPVQSLESSGNSQPFAMFGASIARGVDVDENSYNDIAVGAPAEDKVYLFKTYPIVRPKVEMTVSKRFLAISDTTTELGANNFVVDKCSIEICYYFESLGNFQANEHYGRSGR